MLGEVPLQGEEVSLPQGVVVPEGEGAESPAAGKATPKGMSRSTSSQSSSSGVVEQDSERAGICHHLSVTSMVMPGEPQVITLHLGGQWGIRVSLCSVNY